MTDHELLRTRPSPGVSEPSPLLWTSALPLEGEPAPGREARTFCRLQLESEGLDELADDVEAIASELVRDAVERGATPCRLRLEVGADEVVVTLRDRGLRASQQASELMSRDLADSAAACVAPAAWGWREVGDGRELWCRVDRPRG
jgi:hypothetical protein